LVAEGKGQEKDDVPAEEPGGNCPKCGSALDASGACPQCDPVAGPGGNPGKEDPGNPGKDNPGKDNPRTDNPGKGNPKKDKPGNPGTPTASKTKEVEPQVDEGVEALLKAINVSVAAVKVLSDAGFKTLDDLKNASVEDLQALEGIDEKAALAIRENVSGKEASPRRRRSPMMR
jgi:hypothetical protein